MIDLSIMLQVAQNIALNPLCGYNMVNRQSPDFDCSSFVAYCINQAGGSCTPDFYTGNEGRQLRENGFVDVGINEPARAGDIYFYDEGGGANGHTFIIFDDARYVHASGRKMHPNPADPPDPQDEPANNNHWLGWQTGDQSQTISADGYDYTGEICFGWLPYDLSQHNWYHYRLWDSPEPTPPPPPPPTPDPPTPPTPPATGEFLWYLRAQAKKQNFDII